MNKGEIIAMPAGLSLDIVVGKYIFEKEYHWSSIQVPNYSENISAAWEVVNKTSLFNVCMLYGSNSDTHWGIVKLKFGEPELIVTAETAPLVICRAALLEVCFPKIGA
jgi:hypothetical protein